MTTFRGAYTALITPFTEDGRRVDLDRLARNVDLQAVAGVTGVVPCGTTGETPTLTAEEYRAVVERTIGAAESTDLAVIPGAGSNSTAHALELHRFVHEAGADAALHVTPYYNKPSQEGMYRHFMAIADSCDLPIVLYNIPGRTGVMLSMETLERLDRHPNIQAVKDATGGLDLAAETVARTGLTVLSGDDPLTLPMAAVGGAGVISVASNLVPDRVAKICHAFLRGDWESARTLAADLLPLARALLGLGPNPVPLKTALHLLRRDTGAVRLPLCPPPGDVVETLRGLLETHAVAPVGAVP